MELHSEHISAFLDWLRDAEQGYNMALDQEEEDDDKTQDMLHKLELEDTAYHDLARLGKALVSVRRSRRQAKDTAAILAPVMDWKKANKTAISSLEKLLGAVRKEEAKTQGRIYHPRTNAVRDALEGSPDKGTSPEA